MGERGHGRLRRAGLSISKWRTGTTPVITGVPKECAELAAWIGRLARLSEWVSAWEASAPHLLEQDAMFLERQMACQLLYLTGSYERHEQAMRQRRDER